MSRFLDALRSGRVLLMDGAMDTELQRAGLKPGECGELWNLTHPACYQPNVTPCALLRRTSSSRAAPPELMMTS